MTAVCSTRCVWWCACPTLYLVLGVSKKDPNNMLFSNICIPYTCICTFSVFRADHSLQDVRSILVLDLQSWQVFNNVKPWLTHLVHTGHGRRKAMASLLMLVAWGNWNYCNARVFNNKFKLPTIIFAQVCSEAPNWVTAGAKDLCNIISREY